MAVFDGSNRCILASRSPRRRELLRLVVPDDLIDVVPPPNARESGFEGLSDRDSIERRLESVAATKADAVLKEIAVRSGESPGLLVSADTVIVVRDAADRLRVLGQPPDSADWREVVAGWFREFYAGRTHWALTALCVQSVDGKRFESITATEVEFYADVERRLDWYLSTGESRGKAGGYALQGAGSVFVRRVTGSISNVIGLPLESLCDILNQVKTTGKTQ